MHNKSNQNGDLPVRCTFPSSHNFRRIQFERKNETKQNQQIQICHKRETEPRTKCKPNTNHEKNHTNKLFWTGIKEQKYNGKIASTNSGIRYDDKQWLQLFFEPVCSCTWSFWLQKHHKSMCVCFTLKIQHSQNQFQPKKSTPIMFKAFTLCGTTAVALYNLQLICNGAKNFWWYIVNFCKSIFIEHIACLYHKSNKHCSTRYQIKKLLIFFFNFLKFFSTFNALFTLVLLL